ncbi:MAG: biotin-dependent carboxyltransferase family protein [Pyrinomonadaceae bacterium]
MSVLINNPGILTTVQDAGRFGFRRFGINPNGAMDKTAANLLNILLGNDEAEAVLEMHFPAPEIVFAEDTVFALGGADFSAKLNGEHLENWKPYRAEKESVLKFTGKNFGNRAYLSVTGGFAVEKWLGSTSTNLTANIGGFSGRKLKKNDRLLFKVQGSRFKVSGSKFEVPNIKISASLIPFYSRFPTVRVVAGAEFESLTALSEQTLRQETFIVSQNSDRMGFRLDGEPLFLIETKELVSSAVNFGTIQILPDGQLIILMADAQTSGGYPRIAHIIEIDLPLVAQLGANDRIAFQLISIEEAENITLEREKNLNFLRVGCKFSQI